ncbi:MAG: hypothetical protein R3266_02170, partial [Gemmatimonadota bacterium]|nr:hypothetical protein [Gemmatimonadota bacterium]
ARVQGRPRRVSDAYRRALEEHGLQDVQPSYRKLLLELKSRDAAAYEQAVVRYREDVEGGADEGADPLPDWIAYGRWLAERIEPGSLREIESNGRARDAGEPARLGPLLIHLPDDEKRRGFLVAMPAEPSEAQQEAVSLLCG